jgi:hypothetical protein
MQTVGTTAAAISIGSGELFGAGARAQEASRTKGVATIRGAFIYPSTDSLREVGYYSWPGSTFDAEGRQMKYMSRLVEIEKKLGIRIEMDEQPIHDPASIAKFVEGVKASKPDGMLLFPFKKTDWQEHGAKMVEEAGVPTVILATLGVLLIGSVRDMLNRDGVYMISAQDDLDAVEEGLRMIAVARWMKDARIVNLQGDEAKSKNVPRIGTEVHTVPRDRFVEVFNQVGMTDDVKVLNQEYLTQAKEIVEPTKEDVLDAAKTYFVLKQILQEEQGDAMMMECLPGLMNPHQHVPPCMGFMSLRDEGIAMGCESDLDATLTLMLLQELCGKPGFQHNPTVDTVKNHYICAHCTSASKMNGVGTQSEPYILRSHAEAGWGTVPRVLFKAGQEVTVAKYLSGEKPQLLLYSGEIIGCPPIPPTGGCRTNVETTINELEDVAQLKGHHLCMIYGNYTEELKRFCRLHGVEVVT